MNDGDRDPVEDFFARERAQVESFDGDDLHWQVIVRRSRVQRRSRFLGYAAGVAAAALVIGGVTYEATLRDDKAPAIAASNAVGSTGTPTAQTFATGEKTPGATSTPPIPVQTVPKSFTALSVTNVGGGNLFVLGSISCVAGRCPVLIGSTDNGRSWHLVSALKNNSSSVHDQSTGMAANEVTEVRFANTKVGWVYGPDLQYTTDGGRTFRPYGHLGQHVVDVETDGSQVIVTSVDACATTGTKWCPASHVARASISASGAKTEVGTGAALSEFGDDLQVEFDGQQPYVSTRGPAPQRITAGGLVPLAKLGGTCGGVIGRRVIATADPQGGLFAFCPAVGGGAAGSIGLSVLSSKDQGRSWASVSSGALVMGINIPRSFAAANARDLLAVSGGSDSEGRRSMLVSHDGGKTWRDPGAPPPMPPSGWAWVGAPGGTTFYAISDDAVPAFWKSDDSGETWTKVGLTS